MNMLFDQLGLSPRHDDAAETYRLPLMPNREDSEMRNQQAELRFYADLDDDTLRAAVSQRQVCVLFDNKMANVYEVRGKPAVAPALSRERKGGKDSPSSQQPDLFWVLIKDSSAAKVEEDDQKVKVDVGCLITPRSFFCDLGLPLGSCL
jgi:hypothetical protein